MLSDAYRRQHGLDSVAPVIVNLYGPHDNFDLEDSHVVAAMVRKFVEASRRAARSRSSCGAPASHPREFLYVDDAAQGLCSPASDSRPRSR